MVTRDELAALLADVNVEQVAEMAGVSTKTIYRLRHKQHSPSLDTVVSILRAVEKMRQLQKAAA